MSRFNLPHGFYVFAFCFEIRKRDFLRLFALLHASARMLVRCRDPVAGGGVVPQLSAGLHEPRRSTGARSAARRRLPLRHGAPRRPWVVPCPWVTPRRRWVVPRRPWVVPCPWVTPRRHWVVPQRPWVVPCPWVAPRRRWVAHGRRRPSGDAVQPVVRRR